jgi:hypothetical protein
MSTAQQAKVQQLLNERATFESAYQAKQIKPEGYNTAMQYNTQQLSQQGYDVKANYSPAPRPSQDFVGPMPPVISSFEATSQTQPTQQQSGALDQAKQQATTLGDFRLRANTRQGTSPTGPTMNQITANLNKEDKASFEQWQAEKPVKAMVNLGLFVGAGAVAPVLGPVGAVQAVGLGLGIGQGAKTVSIAMQGGDIRNSLLTPQEALEAAETGILFTGLSKGVMTGLTTLAPKSIAQTVSNQGAKGVFARAAVNAGIGGVASYGLSGGKPEAFVQGAAFGGAFSLGGEALGAGAAKINAKYNIAPRIFGVKAQELVGVSEIEKQVLMGKEIKITRLTKLETDTVRLSYKEANAYKELLGTYSKPRILLGGTETVAIKSKGEYTLGFRTAEVNRSAQPVFEALKGKPYTMKELRMGNINKFVETPSANLATQKTEVTTGIGRTKGDIIIPELKINSKTLFSGVKIGSKKIIPEVKIGNKSIFPEVRTKELTLIPEVKTKDLTIIKEVRTKGKVFPEIKATKLIKTLAEPIVPAEKFTTRDFSGIQIKAELGNGKYTKFEDLLLKNSKAMTFTDKPLKEPMQPLAGSIGSKKAGAAIDEQFKLSQSKIKTPKRSNNIAKQVQVSKEEVKAITFPKNIVKVESFPIRANFGGSTRASNFDQEGDLETLSFPKQSFRADLRLTPKTQLTQTPMFKQNNILTNKQATNVMPFTLSKQATNLQAATMPKTMTSQLPKLTQPTKQTSRTMPMMNLPVIPKRGFPIIPGLGLGGGFDNLGPKGNRTGQWFQKKHKIKTYSQMLNTFGVGKAAKPMRQVDKALSKHINKLDKKLIRKSVRRTKR